MFKEGYFYDSGGYKAHYYGGKEKSKKGGLKPCGLKAFILNLWVGIL
jgi:hypothetical protein